MVEWIFLDSDGVLFDLESGIRDTLGFPRRLPGETCDYQINREFGMTNEEMWDSLPDQHEFFANLKPFPWALELWNRCNQVAPTTILTRPTHSPESITGKYECFTRHFGTDVAHNHLLIGKEKWACAATGKLLIDDHDENIKKFRHHGGKAILSPAPWNVYGEYNIHIVYQALERIVEYGLSSL